MPYVYHNSRYADNNAQTFSLSINATCRVICHVEATHHNRLRIPVLSGIPPPIRHPLLHVLRVHLRVRRWRHPRLHQHRHERPFVRSHLLDGRPELDVSNSEPEGEEREPGRAGAATATVSLEDARFGGQQDREYRGWGFCQFAEHGGTGFEQ